MKRVTPELNRQLIITSQYNSGLFSTHGIAPVHQQIRSMRLAAGRVLAETDFAEKRRGCLLGSQVRKQLCANRSAAGATVRTLQS